MINSMSAHEWRGPQQDRVKELEEQLKTEFMAGVEAGKAQYLEELHRVEAERDELLAAAEQVIAISDRKHDAWDRLKSAIASVKGK